MIAPPKPPAQDELEALIKEARERQLRRRLLAAAGVAVAAALGLGIYAILVGGGSQQHSTTSRNRPQAAAAPCSSAAGWRLRIHGRWSEPTESNTAPLAVTRIGAQACTLRGYPQIVLLGASGHKLNFPYTHRGDLVVAARTPRAVHVAGGGSAFFLLNKSSCVVRNAKLARRLQVRLPGVRGLLTLRLPHYPMLGYCPTGLMTVAVSPIVANLGQAAAELP